MVGDEALIATMAEIRVAEAEMTTDPVAEMLLLAVKTNV